MQWGLGNVRLLSQYSVPYSCIIRAHSIKYRSDFYTFVINDFLLMKHFMAEM